MANTRKPDFQQLLKVCRRERPDRPVLFELFLNDDLYKKYASVQPKNQQDYKGRLLHLASAFKNLGYDYASTMISFQYDFFPRKEEQHRSASVSQNEGASITDERSFEAYPWQDLEKRDYSHLETVEKDLPEGMRLVTYGPSGVLENVTNLVGFDNLCFMLYDNPDLVKAVFDKVGSTLLKYYEIACRYPSVGACIVNDDWGFKTQTLFSLEVMRKHVVPWHRKIAELIHASGRPVIMHSCGNLTSIMDDIIDDIKVDAKHSWEDAILPVEEAYVKYGKRVAVMGGIDVDFICRQPVESVKERCRKMLELTSSGGAYALGTGNSVPIYMPEEKYLAMTSCALEG